MIVSLAVTLSGIALAYFSFSKLKGSKREVLKGGDLVLLQPAFMKEYPQLPKDYPMHIEKLEDDYATVVYMHNNNREMCHTKVWKNALKKVS